MTNWGLFTRSLIRNFAPPICRDTLDDLAPPRYTGTVNNHIDDFTAYVLHANIVSKLH